MKPTLAALRVKKTVRLWPVGLATLVLAVSLLYVGCATTFVPSDADLTCIATPTEFAGWFEPGSVHGGVVDLNGIAKPADSRLALAPNCGFYKWSEQMFLWLTSPAPLTYGGGGGIIFN